MRVGVDGQGPLKRVHESSAFFSSTTTFLSRDSSTIASNVGLVLCHVLGFARSAMDAAKVQDMVCRLLVSFPRSSLPTLFGGNGGVREAGRAGLRHLGCRLCGGARCCCGYVRKAFHDAGFFLAEECGQVRRDTGRKVAIKRIKKVAELKGLNYTALREIRYLQEIRHENVVTVSNATWGQQCACAFWLTACPRGAAALRGGPAGTDSWRTCSCWTTACTSSSSSWRRTWRS